jgi:hypothetical protein
MKATWLLLMISCAVLTPGAAYADASSPASQQTSPGSGANIASNHPRDSEHAAPADSGKPHKREDPDHELPRVQRHVSGKTQPRSLATVTGLRPKQLQQLPNNSEHLVPANPMNRHQAVSGKSDDSRTGAFIQNKTVRSAPTVRPLSVIQPALPLRSTVRYRGAAPVAIGGSALSGGRNIGTISGTRMIHRP